MVEKIVVRAPNWMGDAVMAIPTLSALRRAFKNAEIVLLAKPAVAALFEEHPDIDQVMIYDDPGKHAGLSGFWRLSRMLRSTHFDMAFLLQNAFEAALLTALAGIPERLGFATDGRGFLLTHALKKKKGLSHRSDVYLSLMTLVHEGSAVENSEGEIKKEPYLVVTAAERKAVRLFLESLDVSPSGPLIGINPGAAYGTAKRWLPKRFAELADRLADRFHAEILIFGGKTERETAREIQGQMKSPSVILTGKTTVRQMMASITQCGLFITNDSGPMHVASALGIPQVAIFGPTNPEASFPRGKTDRLVYKQVDCAPCRNRICPTDHRCMEGLSVDAVFDAAVKQMSGFGKRQGAVFLDRDGTINDDTGYIDSIERFSLIPGAAAAIARLNRGGMTALLVTNQSGIARSLFSEAFLDELHLHLRRLLAREGAHLDGLYYCPHHPDWMVCECRKPADGLIKKAILDYQIDFSKSYVVGDKPSDVLLAQGTAKSVLVQTGDGVEALKTLTATGKRPDHVSKDLSEAVDWILGDLKEE